MIQLGFRTDRGLMRKNNEDAYFVMPEEKVFIVADGVGGENAGEVASREAVSLVAEYIRTKPIECVADKKDIAKYFEDCLQKVNASIYNKALEKPEHRGMATTLVVAYLKGETLYVVNVGDSRGYIVRKKEIVQITEDHTYVNKLINMGKISREDEMIAENRHIITKAIGTLDFDYPDVFEIELEKDDVIILCTDGLHGELKDDEILEKVLECGKMSELANELVDMANLQGGPDNVTVVCFKI